MPDSRLPAGGPVSMNERGEGRGLIGPDAAGGDRSALA